MMQCLVQLTFLLIWGSRQILVYSDSKDSGPRCNCADQTDCDNPSGCRRGCMTGFVGLKCQECEDGRYGPDCGSICGFCRNNTICDKKTGHCADGCENMWLNDRCDTHDEFFGPKMDLVFILEPPTTPQSLDILQLIQSVLKEFLGAAVKIDDIVHIGVAVKRSSLYIPFYLNTYSDNKEGMYTALGNLPKSSHLTGNRSSGLLDVIREMFNSKNGDRSQIINVCILISCGQSRIAGSDSVSLAKEQGVKLIKMHFGGTIVEELTEMCPIMFDEFLCEPIKPIPHPNISMVCSSRTTECEDGTYGMDCSSTCGHCFNDAVCNKTDGSCPQACKPGWTGEKCVTECVDGTYGLNCSSTCGHCLNDAVCNKADGRCPKSCKPGWTGEKCDTECVDGTYGLYCSATCGHCLNDAVCHKTDGRCPKSCKPGWTGENCNSECVDGTYGLYCSSNCGHCMNNAVCNKTDGRCPQACKPGWTGEKCVTECVDGTYGLYCSSTCGHCLNDAVCNKTDGRCPKSCKPGWTGEKCVTECVDGTYGLYCSSTCGHCLNDAVCNKADGRCPKSCKPGWTGEKCVTTVSCTPKSYVIEGNFIKFQSTVIGKTYLTTDLCYADNSPLGEVDCVDDGHGGAIWGTFRLNQACNFSTLPESVVSDSLRGLLVDEDNNTSVTEVLARANNITENTTLSQRDVLYMTNILEKTTELKEVTPQVAKDVVAVYDKVVESATTTLVEAEEKGSVANRILHTLDSVTAKLKPGPEGKNKLETETFESEVWDLDNKNVTKLPIGLTLSETPLQTNESSSTLFNESSIDYSKTDSAIMLPQEFLQDIVNGSKGKSIRLAMNLYRKPVLFSKGEKSLKQSRHLLDSKVISATILVEDEPVTHLDGTQVTFIFKQNTVAESEEFVTVCGYWNFTIGSWSTDGCHKKTEEAGRVVCVCDHLTNFAVLLDYGDGSEESVHNLPLSLITIIGLSLSITGLAATVMTYAIFRKLLQKTPQQTLFNLCVAQLCAWVVFLTGFNQTQSYVGCILVAVLLHYFIMASFLWMLAEAVLHYLLLVKVHRAGGITSRYMLKTGIPAWGLPLIPVIAVLAMDFDLYRGRESYCWMSWSISLYAFALPVGLVVLCNLLLYVMIVASLCGRTKAGVKKDDLDRKRDILNIRVSLLCFILFGLSWIFGFLAVAEAKVIFQYIFCITASTQGFLIFVLFTARNKQVRDSWRNLCRVRKQKSVDSSTLKERANARRKSSLTVGTSSIGTKVTSIQSTPGFESTGSTLTNS